MLAPRCLWIGALASVVALAQSPRANDPLSPSIPATTQPLQQPPRRLEGIVVHEPPSRPCGGTKFVGAVVLKQLVPQPSAVDPGSGDVIVSLQSSRPDLAKVPGSVRIPPGEQAGRFEVTTVPVAAQHGGFKIVARLANETAESNVVGIRGPRIVSIEGGSGGDCNGQHKNFTANFDCPAPSSGLRLRFHGSGNAEGTDGVAVSGGSSATNKVYFRRCCLSNWGARCNWSVSGRLSSNDGNSWTSGHMSGSCGQPDSCPN